MQLLDIPEQTSSSEIDEEILEIFNEEVEEILEEIVTSFDAWKDESQNIESIKNLRRCFHTLKGSGRVVGATAIGELGWRFENMLNLVIEGRLPRSDGMLALIEQVKKVLPSMLELFQNTQPVPDNVVRLISQAYDLTERKEANELKHVSDVTPSDNNISMAPLEDELQKLGTLDTDELKLGDEIEENELNFGIEGIEEGTDQELDIEGFEDADLEELDIEGFEDADLEELDIEGFGENELELPGAEENELELDASDLPKADFDLEAVDLSEDEPEFETENIIDDNLTLETVDILGDKEILSVTDTTFETEDDEAINAQLFEIFKIEATQHITDLKDILNNIKQNLPVRISPGVMRAFHTLNGSSCSVDFSVVSEIAAPMEEYARVLLERQVELTEDMLTFFLKATHLIENLLNGRPVGENEPKMLLDNVQFSLKSSIQTTIKTVTSPAEDTMPEEAADEFMAIFLEEADEILEKTQPLLERWVTSPDNLQLMKELQRELHTLKGGARMVGIGPMGDLSHHLESVLTQIVEGQAKSNTKLQEIVQDSVDELSAMLEAVHSNIPLETPTDLIEKINSSLDSKGKTETTSVKIDKPVTPSPKVETHKQVEAKSLDNEKEAELADSAEDKIRVQATLIDKITNLTGELSISRAHIEQQQGAVKNNLVEMEQTIIRLRDQLRRLEIETEAQILSHFSGVKEHKYDDQEFDPLELDRFSTIQQLSRALMESVNDLTNIQDFIKSLTRQTDSLLTQQTRIGAELQENILCTRMIPFAKISPRLQRIARLTARELRKQVDFIIEGEDIEFERVVLNRIVAPLEHMLRNAIGHGIEDAPTRQQAGKPSIAKITIALFREGTELIIKLSDDGAGLALAKIRQKAEERGLIKPHAVVNAQEIMQFILESGFSTAKIITQTAGRGVGMDVVNNEIKQLGGSLQISSQTGKGTTFDIRLPLSLTISQALLVHIGDETMAIPMNNVDAVMRVSRDEVFSETDEVRYYKYIDNNYHIFHLGKLLGFYKTASLDTPLVPMLLVRTGERRVALLVDAIEGNKEIVVKPVGPQISAIRWIAGATILGDGRVVLILDASSITRADATPQYVSSQILEIVKEKKPETKTIMIVDDSITVRKITARFLKRQGMKVLTAKDGLDAVSKLQENVPDLMLLDVEMPRMDGYELATQVRNRPELKHLPIIMITSRTSAKHRDKAEKIGVNGYLGKPFNETELLDHINALLAETVSL